MRLAFYQPDIPQNLGTAIRIGACFGVPVDIIEPCGFPLTDRALKRSMMDYGELAEVTRHDSWAAFQDNIGSRRLVLFTTKAPAQLPEVTFQPDDVLLFGRESVGVPNEVHNAADIRAIIPMVPDARSFNVAVSAGIAIYAALDQTRQLPASLS